MSCCWKLLFKSEEFKSVDILHVKSYIVCEWPHVWEVLCVIVEEEMVNVTSLVLIPQMWPRTGLFRFPL